MSAPHFYSHLTRSQWQHSPHGQTKLTFPPNKTPNTLWTQYTLGHLGGQQDSSPYLWNCFFDCEPISFRREAAGEWEVRWPD